MLLLALIINHGSGWRGSVADSLLSGTHTAVVVLKSNIIPSCAWNQLSSVMEKREWGGICWMLPDSTCVSVMFKKRWWRKELNQGPDPAQIPCSRGSFIRFRRVCVVLFYHLWACLGIVLMFVYYIHIQGYAPASCTVLWAFNYSGKSLTP